MSIENMSIYQACRKAAELTQEQAAEKLEISVESVKAYEACMRTPPNGIVNRMVHAYGTPWLALMHVQHTAGFLGVLPENIQLQPMPQAVMQLINRVLEFAEQHRDRQLLRIAEDGIIDDVERPQFETIVEELDDIVRAALQVKFLPDRRNEA